MPRTVSEKMGIKEGTRAYLLNAPDSARAAIQLPRLDAPATLGGLFGYIHLFATRQAELEQAFPRLKPHLAERGMLWVSWPKARQLQTDLTLPEVIRIGYDHGLVESTALRIDDVWSGLKFTHPKPGKVYNNSYGELPGGDGRNP